MTRDIMTVEELKQKFEHELQEYNKLRYEYTEKLRDLLIEYNSGALYSRSENQIIKLKEATIEQMNDIFNEIKMKYDINLRQQAQSIYNEINTSRNKYGANNEYGQ